MLFTLAKSGVVRMCSRGLSFMETHGLYWLGGQAHKIYPFCFVTFGIRACCVFLDKVSWSFLSLDQLILSLELGSFAFKKGWGMP